MPLDPAAKMVIDIAAQSGFELGVGTPEEIRAFVAAAPRPEPLPVARVENRTVAGPAGEIPVRIYWPSEPGDVTRASTTVPDRSVRRMG